jgi:uncharacterized protein (DUF1800 family)
MELFTLGVNNGYTEKDIQAAARAFTGWHTAGGEFVFNDTQHDYGEKTVLGQTGKWNGDEVVRLLLHTEQPLAARFIVRKLYRQFVSEKETPPDGFLQPLVDRFRKSGYDIADLMRTMLRSRHFYSDHAYRQRIKSPAEFVVGMLRSTEAQVPPLALADVMQGMGQILFAPPNVKGWDGGTKWLNSATILARHNAAWKFAQGAQGPLSAKVNPASVVRKHAGDDPVRQVRFLLDWLWQPAPEEVGTAAQTKLVEFLKKDNPSGAAWEGRVRETVHAIMLMPEYQLA